MFRKINLLPVLLLFVCLTVQAQPLTESNSTLVNGYAAKVSGQDYTYYSSVPAARKSLIVRATDGTSVLEWTTAPAPGKIKTDNITFFWLAGIGSSPGKAGFDLAINGNRKFTIPADGRDTWMLKSDDGISLSFKSDMTDQFGDKFGLIYLTVPQRLVTPGKPLQLKVTGNRHGLTSWYMTFKFPLETGFSFKALPAIITENGKEYQYGVAGINYFGEPSTAKIFIGRELVSETPVRFGYNHVKVRLPAVKETRQQSYRIEIAGQTWTGKIEQNPVRKWKVNFVQHTHTDIGYTRPQTEILAEHLRYIDYALDYCDATDNYPDEAKFRWTCEASWAVDEYLRSRPESQVKRLLARIAEGRIEITGMYFNFDELPGEQVLAASLEPLKRFRERGIEVKTAMQNDVNGIGWCFPDFYTGTGIRYLNMGTHGHRALIAFDKPTLFWWESPSGNRMLAWRGEHYMTGNTVFKIHAGNFNVFEEELLNYLTSLANRGYEYDIISIQHSGYLTDNSPPSTLACDMIRMWNEKYTWPKLRTSSATDFFTEMEKRYSSTFITIRGAWPDWWTDGFGASAREVAAVRKAESEIIANNAGLTMAMIQGSSLPEKITDRIDAINSALLFYTEHTVGYHASVREPFNINTMEQRALKESYAWEAVRRTGMLGEETMGLLQSHLRKESKPSIMVYNTLNFKRSGLVKVYIDHQILPRDAQFTITGSDGKIVKAQPLERFSDGTFWALWVNDIPAFGYKKFLINVSDEKTGIKPDKTGKDKIIENRWYRLEIDTTRGTISSIFDKEMNIELTDKNARWQTGEFIYELLDNRSQLESHRLNNYTRETPGKMIFSGFEEGEIWNSIRFMGNTRAARTDGGLRLEIRLFNTEKRIDLVYLIDKKMVTEPEGIYIAFPFSLAGGEISFDVQGGEMRAGKDQIPGSANDWNTVRNYARISNGRAQIIVSSPDAPLMQFGGINTGRYRAGALPETTHIFGWPMNNYWVTNFNAEQHGEITWSYSITSRGNSDPKEALFAGYGIRIPFLARVFNGGGTGDKVWESSIIEGWPENIILVNAAPAQSGKSSVLQVREVSGLGCKLQLRNAITGSPLQCIRVDITGNPVENGSNTLKPLETGFFKITF